MTIKRTPRPRDPIQLGKLMVDIATGQAADILPAATPPKSSKPGRPMHSGGSKSSSGSKHQN